LKIPVTQEILLLKALTGKVIVKVENIKVIIKTDVKLPVS
jgi:hypothetical protein